MTNLEQIQSAESVLAELQMQCRDNAREYWALGLAVQFVRVAWHEANKDPNTAREKLESAHQALAEYERLIATDSAGK
jgi:hypothetical protein